VFDGIEPNRTTLAELKKAWGQPIRSTATDGALEMVFNLKPFKMTEVTVEDNVVSSIVVHLDQPMALDEVNSQLNLDNLVPLAVPDQFGAILGHAYPERGVVLSFAPDSKVPRVAQILVEPIAAEPFVLRALYDYDHNYERDLIDLDYALKLAPNQAQGHWLKARTLATLGRHDEALEHAQMAVRFDSSVGGYRLTVARILGLTGDHENGIESARATVAARETLPHTRAMGECLLGDMTAEVSGGDYREAVGHYLKAIKLGRPLVTDPRTDVRRTAKQALIKANMGLGCCIAMGNYERKREVSAKWFDRSAAYIKEFVQRDRGDKVLPLALQAKRLQAWASLKDGTDPTAVADFAIREGRRLIARSKDPLYQKRIEWELGAALMDAVRVEHVRGKHEQAIRYAETAATLIEEAASARQLTAIEQFRMGRFYFLAGSIHAIGKKDHGEAARWYDNAVPRLTALTFPRALTAERGYVGEWLVSMGVTYWEVDSREKGIELTERGAALMKQAVVEGNLIESALAVPYDNLATMYGELGNPEKSKNFAEMADKLETAAKDAPPR